MSHDLARYLIDRGPFECSSVKAAEHEYGLYRERWGFANRRVPFLSLPDSNVKWQHTADAVIAGWAGSPADTSGVWNACRFCTPDCSAGCVAFGGNGSFPSTARARACKTQFLGDYPREALALVVRDLERLGGKYGDLLRVRLNAFTDLPWERFAPVLFDRFPHVRFFDYTKWKGRTLDVGMPSNYRVTYSASERTKDSDLPSLVFTSNVAVVFAVAKGAPLPEKWWGVPVIDGDVSDNRYDDPVGVVVGLRAKGRMRAVRFRKSGFVREVG